MPVRRLQRDNGDMVSKKALGKLEQKSEARLSTTLEEGFSKKMLTGRIVNGNFTDSFIKIQNNYWYPSYCVTNYYWYPSYCVTARRLWWPSFKVL